LKSLVLLDILPSQADFWTQNPDRRTQMGPVHHMPKKILHLKENGGRYFYRRRVPERHQKTLGIKMWNRPCGDVSYQKAVALVTGWAEEDDLLIQSLDDPTVSRPIRQATEAQKMSDRLSIAEVAKHAVFGPSAANLLIFTQN
jgi:hypothetical protein